MKASLLLVLVMSAVSCVGPGNYSQADIKDAILAVMGQQAKDWTAGDYEGFMKGYHNSEDLRFAHPKGITRGWQTVMELDHHSIALDLMALVDWPG
jgi:hypothetical protein